MAKAAKTVDTDGTEIHDEPPNQEIAVIQPQGDASFLIASAAAEVIRHVSIPVLSLKFDALNPRPLTFTARIVQAIEQGKAMSEEQKKKLPESERTREPAWLCMIQSVTGEVRTLVVGETLRGDLVMIYPNDTYVGSWFRITKFPPASGKRYATYKVEEIASPIPVAAE